MRTLASLSTIKSLSPIEGSDFLELAEMTNNFWKVVVKKGEHKVGDKVVYFEIDSFLPVAPPYEFLRERCYKRFEKFGVLVAEGFRLKTVKLRGQISQGLILPINAFDTPKFYAQSDGDDWTFFLGVRHYDEVREQYDCKPLSSESRGAFPSWIVKTDEERLQNLPEYFTDNLVKDVEFECTEKMDGSSMTVYYNRNLDPDQRYGVCSRNVNFKLDSDCKWVAMAKKLGLEEKLKDITMDGFITGLVIQGELVGPNIQGNRDKRDETEFFVFRIMAFTKGSPGGMWLDTEHRLNLCDMLGLKHVPIIKRDWKVFQELTTFDAFMNYVDAKTSRGNRIEGMVWKSPDGVVSFKVINNKYLCEAKED